MQAIVHGAGVQDRDGGVQLMATLFGLYPFLLKLYADGDYQGPKSQRRLARVKCAVNVEIVRRCDGGGFIALPKRWIVERTIAWLTRDAWRKIGSASIETRWHSCARRQRR